uniref:Translocase of outer mitochondrial membrane 40 homolog-like n=1 Tax=Nothobranchius furzeri TaxID=105023 RepID=A0A1A8AAG7_NOTFU
MGSVLALSSSLGHQNWPFSTEPPPSRWDAHPAHWDSPPRWERRDDRLPNPGSFHSLHRSCKDVFPNQIEGVKMIVNKTLSSFFKVSHTLHLSAVSPSYYRFHVEHLQSDDCSKDKDAPALIGEMDSSGSLNAHALLHLTEHIRARTVFQTQQSQFVTWQFETEYRGSDFTAAVTVANPDILRESECVLGTGFGWGTGLPSRAGRGRGNPYLGGPILRTQLGRDAECWQRRRPCQLLPQSQ